MVRIHPAIVHYLSFLFFSLSHFRAFVRRACSRGCKESNGTQRGVPLVSLMVSLDSYQNTSRFSHDAITRHGANQRYTLLHVRGCARETVFFFYVQKKRSARVHVEARVKHGGLMNYNISLNISLPSSPLFSFRRILGIKALSHQCATTTPGKAALAP